MIVLKILCALVFGFIAFIAYAIGSTGPALFCVAVAAAPLLVPMFNKREEASRQKFQDQQREQREADRVRAEEERLQRQIEADEQKARERTKQFEATQKEIGESSGAIMLRSMVNEVFALVTMLKKGEDNQHVISGIHEVLGRLMTQTDIQPAHYTDPNIVFDIGLISEQLEAVGLKEDMVYRRAEKVLKISAPQASLIANKHKNQTPLIADKHKNIASIYSFVTHEDGKPLSEDEKRNNMLRLHGFRLNESHEDSKDPDN